jgi:uncharacterized protein
MITTLPATTALCAAILGLLGAALTVNVIVTRVKTKIDTGDGGIAALAQAIRAQGNFIEQAPLALIVIGFAEAAGARAAAVWAMAGLLVASRLASAFALSRSLRQSPLRQFGGGTSFLVLAAASIMLLLALFAMR